LEVYLFYRKIEEGINHTFLKIKGMDALFSYLNIPFYLPLK